MRQGRWAMTAMLLLATVSIGTADDRGAVTTGGGVFAPYGANVGGMGLVSAEGRVSQHLSVGGEVEYNHFDDRSENADVGVESVGTRGLVRYTWFPAAAHPYVGAGAGVGVHLVHGTDHAGPFALPFAGTGASLSVLGLAGIDVPVSQSVSLFAEGRISGDFGTGLLAGSQLGGVAGASGARFHF